MYRITHKKAQQAPTPPLTNIENLLTQRFELWSSMWEKQNRYVSNLTLILHPNRVQTIRFYKIATYIEASKTLCTPHLIVCLDTTYKNTISNFGIGWHQYFRCSQFFKIWLNTPLWLRNRALETSLINK